MVIAPSSLDSKLAPRGKASEVRPMASQLKHSKKRRRFGEGEVLISNLVRFYKYGYQEDRSLSKKGAKCE